MSSDRLHVEHPYRDALTAIGLTSARAVLEHGRGRVVAQSRTTSVIRTELPDGTGVYLKRYVFPTPRDRRRGALRGTLFGATKAQREFENLRVMRSKGWPVPEAIGYGECRERLFLAGCALVTLEIPSVVSAQEWLASDPAARDLRRAVRRCGDLVRKFHENGYVDGSLALRNFLLNPHGAPDVLYKVDCTRGRWGRPGRSRAAFDLARLEASAGPVLPGKLRLGFLKAYLDGKLGRDERRRFVEKIANLRRRFDMWERPRLTDGANREEPAF